MTDGLSGCFVLATSTEAIRKAPEERRVRLSLRFANPDKHQRLFALLEEEIWPQIPADQLGKRLSKDEEEALLGYGELGI